MTWFKPSHRTENLPDVAGFTGPSTWGLFGILLLCLLASVALPASGQVSIPPSGNIGLVAGNGTIGFVTGVQANDAEFYFANGLAFDVSGTLWIRDMDNCVVDELDLSTGLLNQSSLSIYQNCSNNFGLSTTLAAVPLSGSVASLTVSTLDAGQHTIMATYSGDANFE